MNEERWDRYKPQLIPLSKNLDELHILAVKGREPKEKIKNIFFHFYKYETSKSKAKQQYPTTNKYGRPYVKIINVFDGFKRIRRNIITMKKFSKMIKNLDVDLLYGLSGSGFIQFAHIQMKKMKKIPAIYRMRGNGINERKYTMRFPEKEANQILDFYTSTKYDLYIPIKNEFKTILMNRGINENRISMPIINGVDINNFKIKNYPDILTIGYAGRISKEKGMDFLSNVMKLTPSKNYVICGKVQMNWEKPANCIYMGQLPHSKMVNFYNDCNVIILPSYSEGVSNVMLESYACGRVLIMSNNARPPEIPNFGWELPHDLWEWKKLIESLNIDDLAERGLDAREWVKKLSWDEYGKKMANQFKKILKT